MIRQLMVTRIRDMMSHYYSDARYSQVKDFIYTARGGDPDTRQGQKEVGKINLVEWDAALTDTVNSLSDEQLVDLFVLVVRCWTRCM